MTSRKLQRGANSRDVAQHKSTLNIGAVKVIGAKYVMSVIELWRAVFNTSMFGLSHVHNDLVRYDARWHRFAIGIGFCE